MTSTNSAQSGNRHRGALLAVVLAAVVILGGGAYLGGYKTANASRQAKSATTTLVTPAPTLTRTVSLTQIVLSTVSVTPDTVTITETPTTTQDTPTSSDSANPSAPTGEATANLPSTLDLTTNDPVDRNGQNTSTAPINVSGKTYTQATRMDSYWPGATSFAEYDLARKYNTVTVDFGFADTDKSGISAVFEISVDGTSKMKKTLLFGQTAHASIAVPNALRVRFATSILTDLSYSDVLVWMNPTAVR